MNEIKFINQKDPIITVIVPCYNAQDTITETLMSLERQTFKDFEVIIVNDGSTDKSHFLIEEKLKNQPFCSNYIIQENSGVSVARNRGMDEAKGSYITFLDADDVYCDYFLEVLYEQIMLKNVDTVVCSYTRDINAIKEKVFSNSKNVDLSRKDLLEFFMYRKGPCSFFTFIYRKEIIEKHRIYFNSNLKYGEDLEFTWKYLIHSRNGVFIDEALYGYYDNPFSAMNNISWRKTDVLKSIKNIENILYNEADEFYNTYKNYMFSRALWAVAKDFSFQGQKDFFNRLSKDYDVTRNFKNCKAEDWRVKYTTKLFLLNRHVFYAFFRLLYYVKKRMVL